MGFEVYLQRFTRGEPGGMERDAIRALFPIDETASRPDVWRAWYDDGNWSDIHVSSIPGNPSTELLHSIVVERPCADIRLWDALFGIMRTHSAVLYYPGSVPLVAVTGVQEDLPPDMVEALGKPRLVTSAQEIIDTLQEP
jgi:hypothetical protein